MEKWKDCSKNNRVWSGLILLVIGLVFFLGNMGIRIPHWVLSWHTLLVIIGLLIGYKRNFDGGGWWVMVLVGGYFTLEDIADFNMSKYYFACAFIIGGIYLILKPKGKGFNAEKWKKKHANFNTDFGFGGMGDGSGDMGDGSGGADYGSGVGDDGTGAASKEKKKKGEWVDENDVIEAVSVFGGTDQMVYSKNFKGGEVVAVFGGCNINLSQADFEGTIVLEIIAVFGGVKIILPPSWIVKSEVTAIFGGSDDKRGPVIIAGNEGKIVKITGLALFGGIEIRNF
ncbi:LiaF transmembrane domain-containing protein [Pedobacter caeni]|uniref:Cell wall-active antibiotics response 4TMS YvqF n=1 Tax=Pedobacter caeni TaxID=288992 RepID=A0A1M5GAS6_9SPHI|nr:LiaF domain-containing protein [Pedobacter caeni]SHG00809.1 Cell wall-active antibiotics response 4TMS YvqF [Pedobacter caeni]